MPASAARPVPRWLAVSRVRAFLTHTFGSAAVVGIVFLAVFYLWYPRPYFELAGTWHPLRVLIGVDLVLGPLLTLLLFKPGKKGLLFDLSAILVLQLAALAYGVTVIYSERPYFTVFAVDRFVVLARSEVDAEAWAQASNRVGGKPFVGTVLAVAEPPTDIAAQQRLLEETVFRGKPDIDRRPEFWSSYRERVAKIIARAKPLSALQTSRPDIRTQIAQLPAKLGLPSERLGFVPVLVGTRASALVIDTSTAKFLDVIDQDPWDAG